MEKGGVINVGYRIESFDIFQFRYIVSNVSIHRIEKIDTSYRKFRHIVSKVSIYSRKGRC